MPTDIPVTIERSYATEAMIALMLSLMAAAVDGALFLMIIWACS